MVDTSSAVRVVVVHPDLLGTYGDGGNGLVLARRLAWRGWRAELVQAMSGSPVPSTADIYCLGGGEDAAQTRSALELSEGDPIGRAVAAGAAVLAVCAGFQVIGRSFAVAGGGSRDGIGLIDVRTARGPGRRPVGELVVRPTDPALPTLTGYENHGGVTHLGPGVAPLGRVLQGVGNGNATDGVRAGRVIGTYMHGPVLARNPALADLILAWVVGELQPLDDSESESLRRERLAAAGRRRGLISRLGLPLARLRSVGR